MSEALTDAQKRSLACALDAIIPPSADGRLPGAGELGLAGELAHPALAPGLEALDAAARERGASGFAALPAADRAAALDAVAARDPAFLPGLVGRTYAAYYRHPRVIEALGLEARPPFPRGHTVEPTDFSILDPVRERAPFYRTHGVAREGGPGTGGRR